MRFCVSKVQKNTSLGTSLQYSGHTNWPQTVVTYQSLLGISLSLLEFLYHKVLFINDQVITFIGIMSDTMTDTGK